MRVIAVIPKPRLLLRRCKTIWYYLNDIDATHLKASWWPKRSDCQPYDWVLDNKAYGPNWHVGCVLRDITRSSYLRHLRWTDMHDSHNLPAMIWWERHHRLQAGAKTKIFSTNFEILLGLAQSFGEIHCCIALGGTCQQDWPTAVYGWKIYMECLEILTPEHKVKDFLMWQTYLSSLVKGEEREPEI